MGGKRKDLMFKNWLVCGLFLCLTLGISAQGLAQDEGDEDAFTLEEITVTAEKREAELQKIPMAISVVRPDEMERLGVHSAEQLDELLPDVQADESAGSYVNVSVRNVRSNFWNPIHETTVAMHMDGIQLTRINGFNNMFYDLQRLEVLKGPQGTLYGRGSTAGSMNIISQKPIQDEFSGYLSFEAGNFDLYRTEGALNVPITEKLAMRFAGRTYDHDGYDDSGYGDAHSWGGRVSLNWEPTDKDQIIATFDFEGNEDNGQSSTGTVFGTYGDLTIMPNIYDPEARGAQLLGPTHEIKLPYQSRWSIGNGLDANYNDGNIWGVMLQYEHEFSFAYATALYGHRSVHENKQYVYAASNLATSFDTNIWDGIPGTMVPIIGDSEYQNTVVLNTSAPAVWTYGQTSSATDSLELRLLSKSAVSSGDRFEWVTGYMYQDDGISESDRGAFNPMWVHIQTKVHGLYAQGSYQLIDDLTLTGGYRYSWDEKSYGGSRGEVFSDAWNRNSDAWNWKEFEYKYDYDTYKLNLSWQATEDVMTYLQYSMGIKTVNVDYDGNEIPPEKLAAWELGFRSRFLDNRLQLNASAYFYDYKNYNEWTTVTQCKAHPIYDANGVPVSVNSGTNIEGVDYVLGSVDPDQQNTTDLAMLHECYDGWHIPTDENGDVIDGAVPELGPDGATNLYDYVSSKSTSISPGGSEQYGINMDLMWLITINDTLTLNATWSKNKYKDYDLASAILANYPESDNVYFEESLNQDKSGKEFGGSPIRGNIAYNHSMPFGMDMLNFNIRAQFEGKGLDIRVNENTTNEYVFNGRDEYWVLSASIHYSSSRWVPEGMKWTAQLWCNNLMDSQFFSSISYNGNMDSWANYNINPNAGSYTATIIQPRTMGLNLTLHF